ncbi:MAG: hypothetical protein KAV87_64825 [Desulfobacteraceae bacterium]|nr:hypothetical protein [Desulfobacteraceae bacterium]
MEKERITLKKAAEILGISQEGVDKLIAKGKLYSVKKKKKTYVFLDDVERLRDRPSWKTLVPSKLREKPAWIIFPGIVILVLYYLGFFQYVGSQIFTHLSETLSEPLLVIPETIEFNRELGRGRCEFEVYNSSDDTIFNRSIKVSWEATQADDDELSIKRVKKADEPPRTNELDNIGLPKHLRLNVMGGLIDPDGNKYKLVLIPKVGRKETKTYRVYFIPKDEPGRKGTVKLVLRPYSGPRIKAWVAYKGPEEKIGLRPYIVTLKFRGVDTKTMFDKRNNAWFFADHVGKILHLGMPQKFLKLLEDKEKGNILLDTKKGGKVKQLLVVHYAIPKLVAKSSSPQAEAFKAWATTTVPKMAKRLVSTFDNSQTK